MLTDPIRTKETIEVMAKAQLASIERADLIFYVQTSSLLDTIEEAGHIGFRTTITPKSTSSTKYAY